MRISDWSSDVCSSDLIDPEGRADRSGGQREQLARQQRLARGLLEQGAAGFAAQQGGALLGREIAAPHARIGEVEVDALRSADSCPGPHPRTPTKQHRRERVLPNYVLHRKKDVKG